MVGKCLPTPFQADIHPRLLISQLADRAFDNLNPAKDVISLLPTLSDMSQPFEYPALDPLASLPADREPLPTEKAADGKSLLNLANDKLSPWYSNCLEVIDESNNAFE